MNIFKQQVASLGDKIKIDCDIKYENMENNNNETKSLKGKIVEVIHCENRKKSWYEIISIKFL